ncbi:MAG: Ribose-phosphate pyrophosphokinase [Methanoregulaceae archaeon PtaB.Bin009]|nr:MAG: Ribose-phosphate pyrophosphokinase [Methanoregulaceae archaeon PtaB.Bin009]
MNARANSIGEIIDDPLLRERTRVFSGRHDAGRRLGVFLLSLPPTSEPLVLAIPAGGVPVGKEIAKTLGAPFSLAIVRKVRIPGTTESGFGAVAWDGTVLINERLRDALFLSSSDVERAVSETAANVKERITRFMAGTPMPSVAGKTVILTDDGLASGFTMLAAIRSLRVRGPARVVVAFPTASRSSAELVGREADQLVCLNIRSGRSFAVADAYEEWYDLDDSEVLAELTSIPR